MDHKFRREDVQLWPSQKYDSPNYCFICYKFSCKVSMLMQVLAFLLLCLSIYGRKKCHPLSSTASQRLFILRYLCRSSRRQFHTTIENLKIFWLFLVLGNPVGSGSFKCVSHVEVWFIIPTLSPEILIERFNSYFLTCSTNQRNNAISFIDQ